MSKSYLRSLLAVSIALASGNAMAQGVSDLALQAIAQGREFVPDEMLVQFRPGVTEAHKEEVLSRVGGVSMEMVARGQNDRSAQRGDLELVRIPFGMQVADAVRGMSRDPAVAFAEPNWVYTLQATSNDPLYTNGSLWGMYGDGTSPANQFGSRAGEAWARGNTCSSSVYIGIIDEGVMVNHQDLAANMWTNPFDPVDGRDNDGNGYVDDVNGWDFDGNNSSVFDGTTDDHGTHVAGTIGARGGNGVGVAGVCWNVKMISAKFLGRRGGTTANSIKAVDYMTDLKLRHGLNIVATNNSWGGGGYSQALADAIQRAANANILFVAAAGNETNNNDANPSYPASYTNSNIIAVASITNTGALSSFSNWGATSVDIGAPGSSIQSTLPGRNNTSTYGAYSGTSMATPHVAGAVAMYASANPSANAATIRNAILSSALPTASLAGKTVTGARLNAEGF